jgi:hypothetical protein
MLMHSSSCLNIIGVVGIANTNTHTIIKLTLINLLKTQTILIIVIITILFR